MISGNINLLHDGSGFQGLSGTNTFSGSISVTAGTISAVAINPLGTPGPLGLPSDGNATILLGSSTGGRGILESTTTVSYTLGRPISLVGGGTGGIRLAGPLTINSGSISGQGGLIKLNVGTMILLGTELFHGPFSIFRGNVNVDTVGDIGQPSAFGFGDADLNSATIVLGDGANDSSTISFNSATPQSTNRPIRENEIAGNFISIFAGDASVGASAVPTSNLTLTGGIDLSNSVSTAGGTVVFGGAGTILVSTNPITGTGGRVFLGVSTTGDPSVNGTGTLILSGNNSYGGGTTLTQWHAA